MRGVLLVVALISAAAPMAGQDRTFPQSGTVHTLDKALYSWASYEVLRTLGASKRIAAPAATVGLWAAGMLFEHRKGRTFTAVDKVHDLAAHAIVVIPLATWRRPTIALSSLLVFAASIAITCGRANPRSC